MSSKPKVTLAELKADPPRLTEEQRARLETNTQNQIDAAADADEISPTWSDEQLKRAVFARTLRELRESLGMTQLHFAHHYRINAARLKDWEQARSQPDTVAEAYIAVIRHSPAMVDTALATALPPVAKPHGSRPASTPRS